MKAQEGAILLASYLCYSLGMGLMFYRRLAALLLLPMLVDASKQFTSGTSILAAMSDDGIVLASDGLTVWKSVNPEVPLADSFEPAEPKVAICGGRFLCATAGVNPLVTKNLSEIQPGLDVPVNLEYHFQSWLPVLDEESNASVLDYAKMLQQKARITFKDMDLILSTENFWKTQFAAHRVLIDYIVVGYDGAKPTICELVLKTDRDTRKMIYDPPECKSPNPEESPVLPFGEQQHIRAAKAPGTPEASYYLELRERNRATARTLFPKAPAAFQNLIAQAATLIRVEGKFNPEHVGGITTVGVIPKGQKPSLLQFQ
jgi:hypothetical protein